MKIYTATPNAYLKQDMEDDLFFSRDMGLTCYALRELGVISQVVMLNGPTTKEHKDIIRATIEEMKDAQWWKQFRLDAVVLGGGVSPQHESIARAIKESGAQLIVRCDFGSAYSQWQKSVWRSAYENYLSSYYKGKSGFYGIVFSAFATPFYYLIPSREKKVVAYKSLANLVLSETPEGMRYLKALLCRYRRPDAAARVKYVPHPISSDISCPRKVKKEKRIIAVGRWNHYLKNAPLLMHSLGIVLLEHKEYEAHIFGRGEDALEKIKGSMGNEVARRIHVRGQIPNSDLYAEYRKSRIYFAPSRSDGFNIAGAEALSSGCSFVGSGHLFSFRNFVSNNSGTLARRYSKKGMAEALTAEIIAWEEGLRDPVKISAHWGDQVNRFSVAQHIVNVVRDNQQ